LRLVSTDASSETLGALGLLSQHVYLLFLAARFQPFGDMTQPLGSAANKLEETQRKSLEHHTFAYSNFSEVRGRLEEVIRAAGW
jgi:hypothetical protein